MKSRTAAITVSLSWVFMAIVGTFFIVIAYNIISTYQANEEAKFEIELKQNLRSIFNNVGRTAGIEENSVEPIGNIFADREVELICVDGLPILSLDGILDANNDFLQQYPVFMTSIRQGRAEQTYLAVESFRLPFKTTNMLGILSKKNVIVVDSNSDISEGLIDKFKSSSYKDLNIISQNFASLAGIEDSLEQVNANSVTFVSDNGVGLGGITLGQLNIEAYHLEVEQLSDKRGILYFTDKEGEELEFPYMDSSESLAVVTMAAFSRPETFECSYSTIVESLPAIYEFYIQKTQDFENRSSSEKLCSSSIVVDDGTTFIGDQQEALYRNLREQLEEIKIQLENEKFNNSELSESLLDELDLRYEQLEEFNCQYVY